MPESLLHSQNIEYLIYSVKHFHISVLWKISSSRTISYITFYTHILSNLALL